jgi:hypothetical protein
VDPGSTAATQAQERMGRSSIALLTGDWDAALRWGREALDLASAHGSLAVTFQTWLVLAPIATYRGDTGLLRELDDWLRAHAGRSDLPAGRLMRAALDHQVAAGTGADPVMPDADRLRQTWSLPDSDAASVAARDAILRAWWDDGRFDDLSATLAVMPDDPVGAPLAAAARRLWLARMGATETEIIGRAREALGLARRWGAAWWIEQAIAILDDAGDATRDEREERRLIRLRLLGDP